jgi:hypothetical protein
MFSGYTRLFKFLQVSLHRRKFNTKRYVIWKAISLYHVASFKHVLHGHWDARVKARGWWNGSSSKVPVSKHKALSSNPSTTKKKVSTFLYNEHTPSHYLGRDPNSTSLSSPATLCFNQENCTKRLSWCNMGNSAGDHLCHSSAIYHQIRSLH